jgi:hypothetical protein
MPSMLRPSSKAASSRLGVITVASGNSSRTSAWAVSGTIRRSPLVATITGSSTTLLIRWRRIASATAHHIGRGQHADLDGIDAYVLHNGIDLAAQVSSGMP